MNGANKDDAVVAEEAESSEYVCSCAMCAGFTRVGLGWAVLGACAHA